MLSSSFNSIARAVQRFASSGGEVAEAIENGGAPKGFLTKTVADAVSGITRPKPLSDFLRSTDQQPFVWLIACISAFTAQRRTTEIALIDSATPEWVLAVAVVVTCRARTDPYVQNYRIRLLHWVRDAK